MKGCENIVVLTKELGVSRRQLYRWRDELDPERPEVGEALVKKVVFSSGALDSQKFSKLGWGCVKTGDGPC